MTAPFIGTLPHGGMEVASTSGYAILFRTASSTRLTSSSVTSKSSDEYGNQTAFPTDRVRLIFIIIVVPRSRVVAEMKPYTWAEVYGYAGTTVVSSITYVVVLNVTTVVWPITYVVLRHAASPVVIHAASAAMRSFRDS